MTDPIIKEHICDIWESLSHLKVAALDMQPGEHREVVINLTGYLVQDTRYMAHKLGIELE